MNTHLKTRALASLAAACAIALPSHGQGSTSTPISGGSTSSTVTVVVCCSSQGIVDDDHKVKLTVTGPNGDCMVMLSVESYSESESIAGGLAILLNEVCGTGASSKETMNKRFKNSPHTAQDLCLPSGWKVKEVTVERRTSNGFQPNDGQLKVYDGKKKISNDDAIIQPSLRYFRNLEFHLVDFTGAPLALELDLYAPNTEYHHKSVYPVLPAHPLSGLGTWLQGLGATVSYPSARKMTAMLPVSLAIEEVWFMASEETDATSPPLYTVTYRFEAN